MRNLEFLVRGPGQVSAQIGRPVRAHLPAMVNACDLYDSAASPKGELGKNHEELSARICKEARRVAASAADNA